MLDHSRIIRPLIIVDIIALDQRGNPQEMYEGLSSDDTKEPLPIHDRENAHPRRGHPLEGLIEGIVS